MRGLDERFVVHEALGSGSFGDVFLATDTERGERVAVKRLRAPSAARVQRFKQEFRALSQLHHPNLVTLYELCVIDDQWLLVMEALRGARPQGAAEFAKAVPGIARGLHALHGAGYLHRDLKRDNVMLTEGGRAVLLDFGLLGRAGAAGTLVGNLLAIAPEQAAGSPVGPAGDWYALGVMLYMALVGSPPFEGRGTQVLAKKMRLDAPRVDLHTASHEGLARLTNALLLRDPVERMARATPLLKEVGAPTPRSLDEPLFVGRGPERATLEQAWSEAQAGALRHVHMRGDAGMGKSALLESWAQRKPKAVWLRCFERDSSAYAGLDSVVERLLEAGHGALLTKAQRAALATVFPSLRERFAALEGSVDSAETRRLAATALDILLRAHAGGACPVLIIDDAQWGGTDSGDLLRLLLRPPSLLVTASRGACDVGGLMRALADAPRAPVTLELEKLGLEDIEGRGNSADTKRLRDALTQADGHPLLLSQLMQSQEGPKSLRPLLRAQARALPAGAAALMQVLVTAARPLDRELLLTAYEERLGEDGGEAAFHALTVLLRQRLARVRHSSEGAAIEPTHALIREACERERPVDAHSHAALDDAMQALGSDAPEHQARHAKGAGRLPRAKGLYVQAAQRASARLAFARASELYAEAFQCEGDSGEQRRLLGAQANALGAAGLHLQAAETFGRALDARTLRMDDAEAMSWGRQRAEHLLHACAMAEGEAALGRCLNAAGIDARKGRKRLVASILMHKAWLRTAGRGEPRPAAKSSARGRAQVELMYSAAIALTNVDGLRGMDFALRSLRGAHRLGDRARFARSFALVAAYSGSAGPRADAHTAALVVRARDFGEEAQDAHLQGMAEAADCLRLFHGGEHEQSLARAEEAERIFRTRAGSPREATTARIYRGANLASLGRYAALRETRSELLEDSLARRDGFGETHARVGLMNLSWLVTGDVDEARRDLERGMAPWAEVNFQIAHFFGLLAGCHIDLYEGRPRGCRVRLEQAMPQLRSSLLLRMPFIRAQISDLNARACVQEALLAPSARTQARALLMAAREARRIRRLKAPIYTPLADVIDAGASLLKGNAERAEQQLLRALEQFRARGLRGHAMAAALATVDINAADELPTSDSPVDPARFCAALGLMPHRV